MPSGDPQVGEVWTYRFLRGEREAAIQIESTHVVRHNSAPNQTVFVVLVLTDPIDSRTELDLGHILQNYTYRGSYNPLAVDDIDPELRVTLDPNVLAPSVIASEEDHLATMARDAGLRTTNRFLDYQAEVRAAEDKLAQAALAAAVAETKKNPPPLPPTAWDRLKKDDDE